MHILQVWKKCECGVNAWKYMSVYMWDLHVCICEWLCMWGKCICASLCGSMCIYKKMLRELEVYIYMNMFVCECGYIYVYMHVSLCVWGMHVCQFGWGNTSVSACVRGWCTHLYEYLLVVSVSVYLQRYSYACMWVYVYVGKCMCVWECVCEMCTSGYVGEFTYLFESVLCVSSEGIFTPVLGMSSTGDWVEIIKYQGKN